MDRLFVLQGADQTHLLLDESFDLVRTYKGDIERTQTGLIKDFPNSFITVGINATFVGKREVILQIQQILLSANVVEVKTRYAPGIIIKGAFSCTTNKCTELRDKGDSVLQLEVSLVSDGTPIGDSSGNKFPLYHLQTLVGQAYFAEVLKLPSAYKVRVPGSNQYVNIPNNELLVLGPLDIAPQ